MTLSHYASLGVLSHSPYAQLPESEKEYDRAIALETLKAIIALGYRIERS